MLFKTLPSIPSTNTVRERERDDQSCNLKLSYSMCCFKLESLENLLLILIRLVRLIRVKSVTENVYVLR